MPFPDSNQQHPAPKIGGAQKPLHYGRSAAHKPTALWELDEAQTDSTTGGRRGKNPLHYGRAAGHKPTSLREVGGTQTHCTTGGRRGTNPLHYGRSVGHKPTALREVGGSQTHCTMGGRRGPYPLHYGRSVGPIPTARREVGGAKTHCTMGGRWSPNPLHYGRSVGHKPTALREVGGAHTHCTTGGRRGTNPLHYRRSAAHKPTAQQEVGGAQTHCTTGGRWVTNPLHYGRLAGHKPTALREVGGTKTHCTTGGRRGTNPLHYGRSVGHKPTALREVGGAHTHCTTGGRRGKNPLHYGRSAGHKPTALREVGGSQTHCTTGGRWVTNPLHYRRSAAHKPTAQQEVGGAQIDFITGGRWHTNPLHNWRSVGHKHTALREGGGAQIDFITGGRRHTNPLHNWRSVGHKPTAQQEVGGAQTHCTTGGRWVTNPLHYGRLAGHKPTALREVGGAQTHSTTGGGRRGTNPLHYGRSVGHKPTAQQEVGGAQTHCTTGGRWVTNPLHYGRLAGHKPTALREVGGAQTHCTTGGRWVTNPLHYGRSAGPIPTALREVGGAQTHCTTGGRRRTNPMNYRRSVGHKHTALREVGGHKPIALWEVGGAQTTALREVGGAQTDCSTGGRRGTNPLHYGRSVGPKPTSLREVGGAQTDFITGGRRHTNPLHNRRSVGHKPTAVREVGGAQTHCTTGGRWGTNPLHYGRSAGHKPTALREVVGAQTDCSTGGRRGTNPLHYGRSVGPKPTSLREVGGAQTDFITGGRRGTNRLHYGRSAGHKPTSLREVICTQTHCTTGGRVKKLRIDYTNNCALRQPDVGPEISTDPDIVGDCKQDLRFDTLFFTPSGIVFVSEIEPQTLYTNSKESGHDQALKMAARIAIRRGKFLAERLRSTFLARCDTAVMRELSTLALVRLGDAKYVPVDSTIHVHFHIISVTCLFTAIFYTSPPPTHPTTLHQQEEFVIRLDALCFHILRTDLRLMPAAVTLNRTFYFSRPIYVNSACYNLLKFRRYIGAAVAERLDFSSPTKASGELGWIAGRVTPAFSHMAIWLDDAASRRVFSDVSRFPRPVIPALLHTHLAIILSATFLLFEPACGKQEATLTTGPSSWNNVGDPPPSVQLDPELRKALLRALTQLEHEAHHQNSGKQFISNSTDDQIDEVQENLKRDLKQLIGNFQVTYENDHKADMDEGVEDQITSYIEDKYREDISQKYQEEYSDSKNPDQDNFQQVTDYIISRDEKQLEVSTTSDEPSELENLSSFDKPTQAALFYHDPEPEDQKKTTELPQEIKNNHHPNDVIASPAEIQNTRDVLPLQKSASSDIPVTPTTPAAVTKSGASDGEVSIFQAPLVAAFTLQQDEIGLPTSVIPLLPPQPTAPTSPGHNQQQVLLLREQELLHRTRLLEQQLAQVQQQRLQQQRLQQQRLQQQLFLEQQSRQAFVAPQQQFIPFTGSSRRPQRQETDTRIVDFQPSIEFPLNHNNQQTPAASSLVNHQVLQPQHGGSFSFQQSPGFVVVSPSQQENGLVPPPLPLQQPPSFSQRQVTPSAANQLQNLLYRAGVQDTPQQDLGIVSKVLSLNHLRRQSDTQSSPSESRVQNPDAEFGISAVLHRTKDKVAAMTFTHCACLVHHQYMCHYCHMRLKAVHDQSSVEYRERLLCSSHATLYPISSIWSNIRGNSGAPHTERGEKMTDAKFLDSPRDATASQDRATSLMSLATKRLTGEDEMFAVYKGVGMPLLPQTMLLPGASHWLGCALHPAVLDGRKWRGPALTQRRKQYLVLPGELVHSHCSSHSIPSKESYLNMCACQLPTLANVVATSLLCP
ncbi:hypothetical protein PR048_016599 [Dryococelus australis]|uniref:Uncharacterized protein n=1 Tax=Dryococelus australis TaxID=614101 RepID=A0ABQ9H784_9NEOP|nr:hypothetical protein PR048_016599 [Dryococelus australis]